MQPNLSGGTGPQTSAAASCPVRISRKIAAALFVSILTVASAHAENAGIVTRDGSRLVLDGKPFRAVGVNKAELVAQYMADLLGEDLSASRQRIAKSLDTLAANNIDVIRICACLYWPVDMSRTFTSPDENTRKLVWQRFDELVNDCAARHIRLVVATHFYPGLWSDQAHESLHDFIANPRSQSRQMHDAFVRELVGRYRDSQTILFWELPNELNLYCDLRPQTTQGLLSNPPALTPGPVIRDARNNFSSDEAAAYLRETASLIKSIDSKHLVGSGLSIPRNSAWHLWLGSLRAAKSMDWAADTPGQQADYIRMMTPDPVDLVCVHQYLRPESVKELDQLGIAIRAAESMGKPIYVGEFGPDGQYYTGEVYSHAAARNLVRDYFNALHAMDVPISLIWGYDEYCGVTHEPVIRPDRHGQVLAILHDAQSRAKADPEWQRAHSDELIKKAVAQIKSQLAKATTQPVTGSQLGK